MGQRSSQTKENSGPDGRGREYKLIITFLMEELLQTTFVMRRFVCILTAVACVALFSPMNMAEAGISRAVMTDFRVGRHKGFLRLVFQFSEAIPFSGPTVIGVGQLSLSFEQAKSACPLRHLRSRFNEIKEILCFRNESGFEIEVEFSHPYFHFKSYVLNRPFRVIVDVYKTNFPTKGFIDSLADGVRAMIKEGSYNKALLALEPFISHPSEYPKLFSDYLVLLCWTGKEDRALELFESLPQAFPKRPYLLKNMAQAYYDKKAFSKAEILYQKALNLGLCDEETCRGLVSSLTKMGKTDQALRAMNLCARMLPDSLPLRLWNAKFLLKSGRYSEAMQIYRDPVLGKKESAEHIYKEMDDAIAGLPPDALNNMLKKLKKASYKGSPKEVADYVLALTLAKKYELAVKVLESRAISSGQLPVHFLYWIAWAYFRTGNPHKAKEYFNTILSRNPRHIKARIGLTYCMSLQGLNDKALKELAKLSVLEPGNLDIRFAKAYAYEKKGSFLEAVKEYDDILERSPGNQTAIKLRLRALSDMGASSYALEEALQNFSSDDPVCSDLLMDMAVDRLRWGESGEALRLLEPLTKDRNIRRARFDHIVALVESGFINRAVTEYEQLVRSGISPPAYVLDAVARAYLHIHQPKRALDLYKSALRQSPDSFDALMGEFYALQEIRKWREAQSILDSMDKAEPPVFKKGKKLLPNWRKLDIALERGWLLAREDRLAEAEEFFQGLYKEAPANIEIRSGLAHVHLWRGWPRKALQEFKIIESINPQYIKGKTGKVVALNELVYRHEATEEIRSLLKLKPRDKDVQDVARVLELEQMRELDTHVWMSREQDGTRDISFGTRFTQPITLRTRLFALGWWDRAKDKTSTEYFKRLGIGLEHEFNSTFKVLEQVSWNSDGTKDMGALTSITVTPDDYWTLDFSFDSCTDQVPMRARANGIRAKKMDVGLTYRESESCSFHFGLSRSWFSDHNNRNEGLLGYEQGLYVKNNKKLRLFVDLYGMGNSKQDTPYYNPQRLYSLTLRLMGEQTLYRMYGRGFVHRLYIFMGPQKQRDYSTGLTGGLRYEQEIDFCDTRSLYWGVDAARNIYDGDSVNGLSIDIGYRVRF